MDHFLPKKEKKKKIKRDMNDVSVQLYLLNSSHYDIGPAISIKLTQYIIIFKCDLAICMVYKIKLQVCLLLKYC